MSFKTDVKQREARDWLRKVEHALSMRPARSAIEGKEEYVKDGDVDLSAINRDLVECHAQVLWKSSLAHIRILESMKEAADGFYDGSPDDLQTSMNDLHASLLSRLQFYHKKLQGIEIYANTTLQRLDVQRNAVRRIRSTENSSGEARMGRVLIAQII